MVHYAVRDFGESALAAFCFLPLFFAPGYLVGWLCDFADFRRASIALRIAWSVPLSFSISTILMVWTATAFGLWFSVAVYGALAFSAAALILSELRKRPLTRADLIPQRHTAMAMALVAIWVIAAFLQLIDLQWGDHLLVSVTVRDHSYRAAFIDSVLRSGVPPTNPLYDTGHPVLMRNYYFWYVVCAVVCKATTLLARNVLVASCVWAATGMFCLAALFCKYFLSPQRNVRYTAYVSMLLFWVTGLDLLMVIYLRFFTPFHRFDGDMEWWDIDHFPSWLDNFLYVPHHVASLVCCLSSLMVLWVTRDSGEPRRRWTAMIFAALAFTSAFGLSIYVAFAFAVTLLLWCLYLAHEKYVQLIRMTLISGALAVPAIVPFMLQLRSETKVAGSKHALPLTLRLRDIYGLDDLSLNLAHRSPLLAAHAKLLRTFLWFLLVTPDLTLELGFIGLCGVLAAWQMRRGRFAEEPGTRMLVMLAGASMVATMVVRSSVSTVNDYGFRTAMLPLFFGLLLAARLITSGLLRKASAGLQRGAALFFPGAQFRVVALAFLYLGVAATLYQAIEVRFFLTLYEHGRLRDRRQNAAFPGMGEEIYQTRKAYDLLDKKVPPSATVQYNPMTIGSYFLWVNMINVRHQIISAEPGCGKSFGGDESACAGIEMAVDSLYTAPAPSLQGAKNICRHLGIDYLVASDQDPAWQDDASWVWEGEPVVSDTTVRILPCNDDYRP